MRTICITKTKKTTKIKTTQELEEFLKEIGAEIIRPREVKVKSKSTDPVAVLGGVVVAIWA